MTTPEVLTPPMPPAARPLITSEAGRLEAIGVSAWFGQNKVLGNVSLEMGARQVTALIGPSGCGKSTFIRILNRMHELVPSAALSGEVLLGGVDIYSDDRRTIETRRRIGMVFQKPNPFPAMSIYHNVLSGLKLSGTKIENAEQIVEDSLTRAGLWKEVRNRLVGWAATATVHRAIARGAAAGPVDG